MANKLIVTAAPHITSADSTQKIMQRVCLALVPTLIVATLWYGISALILTAVTVAACVLFEMGYCKLVGRENPTGDFSAVVTGLLLGNHGGVLGETCALTILVGGIYLIATKVISPVIPVTYLATVGVLSLVAGQDPIVQLLSGGLMLGAFFMATDYVTSPTTAKGKLVFGIGLGVITCAIRFLGTMNEGVSFAILLMNLVVPYIEVLTRQDKLGIAKVKKGGAAK